MTPKQILVGCEESGVVSAAFRTLGHEAWSCDLLPSRGDATYHIQSDVLEAIKSKPWDIIILHPPCTCLCVSGNRWYGEGMPLNALRHQAKEWTVALWNLAKQQAQIGSALENPVGVLGKAMGVKPQTIHPWQFGHGETKTTHLWLDRLPPLKPTNIVEGRENRIWKMAPSDTRQRDRSITYQGWANAMAEQWGSL